MSHATLIDALGLEDADAAFARCWTDHGIPTRSRDGVKTTTVLQDTLHRGKTRDGKGVLETPYKDGGFKNFARDRLHALATGVPETKGAMDAGKVETPTPLVFDPEILRILKEETPLLARLPIEGQAGFKAVYRKLTARQAPIGFVTETASLNLLTQTAKDVTVAKSEKAMKIWVDLAQISEFSQRAAAHDWNVRETALGERVVQWGQTKEVGILYNDPAQAIANSGGIGSAEGYNGFAKIFDDAGTAVDKSAVDISGTKSLAKDIKKEIKGLLQGANAVAKSDLELWTSHTLFDVLENEMEVSRRVVDNPQSVNFGFEMITISGVPVIASHSVDEHTDGAFTTGSEGDVFIMNRRSMRYRALMPLSIVPLGRRGFSEEVALGEFGTVIDRADGVLGKHLKAYAI